MTRDFPSIHQTGLSHKDWLVTRADLSALPELAPKSPPWGMLPTKSGLSVPLFSYEQGKNPWGVSVLHILLSTPNTIFHQDGVSWYHSFHPKAKSTLAWGLQWRCHSQLCSHHLTPLPGGWCAQQLPRPSELHAPSKLSARHCMRFTTSRVRGTFSSLLVSALSALMHIWLVVLQTHASRCWPVYHQRLPWECCIHH